MFNHLKSRSTIEYFISHQISFGVVLNQGKTHGSHLFGSDNLFWSQLSTESCLQLINLQPSGNPSPSPSHCYEINHPLFFDLTADLFNTVHVADQLFDTTW